MSLALLDPAAPGLPYGVVSHGHVLSHGWDVETSDREAFFALTQPHGRKPATRDGDRAVGTYRVAMPEGGWQLELGTDLDDGVVHRRQTLTATGPVVLQDFVCRYRFPRVLFPRARIAGRVFTHRGRNTWHQYPTAGVELSGPSWTATIGTEYTCRGKALFRLDHYVRDEPGPDWVVHARLMPHPEALRWLRWDTRWGRLLDVRHPAALRVLAATRLDRPLWHLAERRGGRPNLELLGLAVLAAGTVLRLDSRLRLRPAPGAAAEAAAPSRGGAHEVAETVGITGAGAEDAPGRRR